MYRKVFTKRHQKGLGSGEIKVFLGQAVRRRLWDAVKDNDIKYHYQPDPSDRWIEAAWILESFEDVIRKEYGWAELRSYQSEDEYKVVNLEGFIMGGVPRFVLDAVELFYDQMVIHQDPAQSKPNDFQERVNIIFEDAELPWRMSSGRIFRVDSKFLEEETVSKAQELMNVVGFEGAQDEFLRARTDLANNDMKGAIANANLALESVMKAILNETKIKPGKLMRKMIDSKIIPEYFEGFLQAFEQILRSVAVARNDEKGVGHGQGEKINDPPPELAKLTIHLAGALIVFLIDRYIGKNKNIVAGTKQSNNLQQEEITNTDKVPF